MGLIHITPDILNHLQTFFIKQNPDITLLMNEGWPKYELSFPKFPDK